MITLIVAHGLNREIGLNNELLWKLPVDMKHFKETTTGKTVVMGRNTFNSIGKPLPNRQNIVLSAKGPIEGVTVLDSIESILSMAKDREIFIIGGEQVYKAFLPYADRLLITLVEGNFTADTYFPDYEDTLSQYTLVEYSRNLADNENSYNTWFLDYKRKN